VNRNADSSATTSPKIDERRPDWRAVAHIERSRMAAWKQLNRVADALRRRREEVGAPGA